MCKKYDKVERKRKLRLLAGVLFFFLISVIITIWIDKVIGGAVNGKK